MVIGIQVSLLLCMLMACMHAKTVLVWFSVTEIRPTVYQQVTTDYTWFSLYCTTVLVHNFCVSFNDIQINKKNRDYLTMPT